MKSTTREESNTTENSVEVHKTDHDHQMKRIKILILIIVVLLPLNFLSHLELLQKNDTGHEEILSDEKHWLENYEPRYGLGAVQYNWWIHYYYGHPESGSPVNHTDWVVASLENSSVIILVHGTSCKGCAETKVNMERCLPTYSSNITYFEFNADNDGNETDEIFDIYDPNSGKGLIPLTVLVTLITDENNETQIAWHSAEGKRSDDWIESYMKDSIFYYTNNSEAWRNSSINR